MFYTKELKFLRETLQKLRIESYVLNIKSPLNESTKNIFLKHFFDLKETNKTFLDIFPDFKSNIIYKVNDVFGFKYIFMLLPELDDNALAIGPYMVGEVDDNIFFEIAEKANIRLSEINKLKNYFSNIPMILDEAFLVSIINTFAETIWLNSKFMLKDVEYDVLGDFIPSFQSVNETNEALLDMQLMEERYKYENELLDAISSGQYHKAEILFSNLTSRVFEVRNSDPVRNIKNYCIVTNTLFRKAAERGGVHPIYIDKLSSSHAKKIELISSVEEGGKYIYDLFRDYCRLVQNHSIKKYSPLVQKTILIIDSDLTLDLRLKTLAAKNNVSPGYLSSLFHKETGLTITDFVNERRVKTAKKLLKTTNLQVQTIAQHCGVDDLQYFSKIFKKAVGKTPKAYRRDGGF